MKIAVWHNLPSGGAKRALYYQIKGLLGRGHTVEAWCPSSASQTYLPLSELIEEHILPFSWTPVRTQTGLAGAANQYRMMMEKIRLLDHHCRACADEINRAGFDVLFANSCMFLAVSPIGRYIRTPKLIYLQEPYRKLYEALPDLLWRALPAPRRYWWSPRYLRWFIPNLVEVQGARVQAREEWSNARVFDAILVNSYFSRETISRVYGLGARVCYLGIDTDHFRPTGAPRENFVVGLGALQPVKGIDRAVRALATIHARQRPELVWIADSGDEDYRGRMEALASELDVRVNFKMRASEAELLDYLNRAALLVYTSRLEPFGFAPLEANACATPVVAIAEGGVRETIKKGINGILVDDDDPIALGRAVAELLEQPTRARELGSHAREEVVQRWNWDAAVDCLENNLHAVIQRRNPINA